MAGTCAVGLHNVSAKGILSPSVFATEKSLHRLLSYSMLSVFSGRRRHESADADSKLLCTTPTKRKLSSTVAQTEQSHDQACLNSRSDHTGKYCTKINFMLCNRHRVAGMGMSDFSQDFHDISCIHENLHPTHSYNVLGLLHRAQPRPKYKHVNNMVTQRPPWYTAGTLLLKQENPANCKPHQYLNVRHFSRRRRDGQEEDEEEERKRKMRGAVMYIPNPLTWVSNKWNIAKLKRKLDPNFSEDDFLYGAGQAISHVTSMVSKGKFAELSGLVVQEECDALALDVEDMVFIKIRHVHLESEKDKTMVYVDSVCFGIKLCDSVPYLTDMGIRFMRDYASDPPGGWVVAGVTHIRLQNLGGK